MSWIIPEPWLAQRPDLDELLASVKPLAALLSAHGGDTGMLRRLIRAKFPEAEKIARALLSNAPDAAHSVRYLQPLDLGTVLHPLTDEDDLLAEMLE